VRLVCVTKTIPVEIIRQAIALEVTDIGENRVQEAREKFPMLPAGVRYHLVGHLQRNKAKDAVELFDMIHSVDSLALAEALEEHAAKHRVGRTTLEVFLQVNVSGETTKFGCPPDQVETLARRVKELPHLHLSGLMTIPPFSDDPEASRPHFRRLRELRDALDGRLLLSMGMSSDFEIAIEEGAAMIRVGTAIFGAR
jgi:pyridoxal phosphate enzyme (YggS family)